MRVVKPPENLTKFAFMAIPGPKIFLSGSIDMGKAFDWQKVVASTLKDERGILLSPRRDDWDNSWKQTMEDPRFVEQVNWELSAMELADLIAVHLEPTSQAPITLLEIGLYAQYEPNKLIIHCPEGYWRKGNIDVVCDRYDILQANSWEEFIDMIKERMSE